MSALTLTQCPLITRRSRDAIRVNVGSVGVSNVISPFGSLIALQPYILVQSCLHRHSFQMAESAMHRCNTFVHKDHDNDGLR